MPIDKIFGALNISSSGLSTQRKRLDIIAGNIANAQTTRTEDGGPYRRRVAVIKSKKIEGFDSILRTKTRKLATSNPKHINGSGFVLHTRGQQLGVNASIQEDPSEFKRIYDPSHPDADEEGYVYLPNINLISEMVDMINASRSYEANLSSMDAAKKMAKAALDI